MKFASIALAGPLIACSAPLPEVAQAAAPPVVYRPVAHGTASGDVTATSATIWARTNGYSALHVSVTGDEHEHHVQAWASEAHDYAASVLVNGLKPSTQYAYTVWFGSDERWDSPPPGVAAAGVFRTAPDRDSERPITFGFSGDLGGLNACRDKAEGYPIFRTIDARSLDFFVGLGDMIYADMKCESKGLYGNDQIPAPVAEAATLRDYWGHWKYNREDESFRKLLAVTDYYAVWDDHEVVNDFGPEDAWRRYPPYVIGVSLVPLGRQALFDENPIARIASFPDRLYRSFRWGHHVELVLLDTRSYRSLNELPDTEEHPKTLLGAEQRAWFEDVVTRSDATWKVVVSSVPISIPTGFGGSAGHDGWANFDLDAGFERELTGIWRKFRDAGTKNVVFVTTDVHFATGFTYHPFPESPEFVVHELVGGPLNAMLLPNHAVDDSFRPERLFFFGPETAPKSYEDAMQFMNWIRVHVDGKGDLTYSVRNAFGNEVFAGALPRR